MLSNQTQGQQRKEHLLDAQDQALGRLASAIAMLLRGKNKPNFTPHIDQGDYVIVKNADKIKFSGKKLEAKIYHSHSTHPGGLKSFNLRSMIVRKGHGEILRRAVYGMLPKNKLRAAMMKRLLIK